MSPGETVAGRFRIEAVAGSGAMGTVYRATDTETGAIVAVKLLRALEHAARFEQEARVLATLRHPRIVGYRAHGLLPDGAPYLVTDWIEGPDLASRLLRGRLRVDEVWALGESIADALGCAHAAGVVHRDVKPANVLLPDGDPARATLVDFGVVRWAESIWATATGVAIGTPAYMAPEQARGEAGVDARADVFAVACVLFECLAGRPPFVGAHALAVLAKVVFERTPAIGAIRADVPPALADVLSGAMAKEAADRPSDGAALKLALAAARARTTSVRSGPSSTRLATDLGLFSVVMVTGAEAPGAPTASTSMLQAPTLIHRPPETGGHVEVLLDGTVLVLFSSAASAADLAVRAASCALRLHAEETTRFAAVSTGLGDRAQPWPVGEVIDKAVDLLRGARASAAPRSVRLDETTATLLGERFDVSQADTAWLLLGPSRQASESRLLLGRATPCVGRDRELSSLESMFEESAEESAPRAAIVVGPPGLGKSRIRLELHRRLLARTEPPALWIARAGEIQASLPFAVAAALLCSAAGAERSEAPAVRRAKLEAFVRELALGPDESRALAFLCELAGIEGGAPHPEVESARKDPSRWKAAMAGVWVQVASAASAKGPLVWTIDDAHWADLPSMDLVDEAQKELRERPLFLLLFGRPEGDSRWAARWSREGAQHLSLAPLPRRACDALAREVLGESAAPDAIARIVEHAAGNAFFLEELIRAAAEGQGDKLPPSVLAMMQARIDSQPADGRHLLRSASVLGMTFTAEEVTDLLEEPAGSRDGPLRRLVGEELLSRRSPGALRKDENYMFRHALLREAAYAMLPEADRSELHERAARGSLRRNDPGRAGDAAEHLERAARGWESADPHRAAGLFAEVAKLRHRSRQVAASLSAMLSALRLADVERCSAPEIAEWLNLLADAVYYERNAPDIVALTRRALARLDAIGALEERISTRIDVARALGSAHLFEECYCRLDEATELSAGRDDLRDHRRRARLIEAETAARSGDFARGARAIDVIESMGPVEEERFLIVIASVRTALRDLPAALQALERADAVADPADLAAACTRAKYRSLAYLFCGDWKNGLEASEKAVEVARRANLRFDIAVMLHNIGDAACRIRDLPRAHAALAESLEIARAAGLERLVAINRIHLAYLDGLRGVAGAEELLRDLMQSSSSLGYWTDALDAQLRLGALLRHRGALDEARRELEAVAKLAAERGNHHVVEDAREELNLIFPREPAAEKMAR